MRHPGGVAGMRVSEHCSGVTFAPCMKPCWAYQLLNDGTAPMSANLCETAFVLTVSNAGVTMVGSEHSSFHVVPEEKEHPHTKTSSAAAA